MALPTKTDLEKMDYAHKAQPFIDVSSKDTIDLKTMDCAFQAQPFVSNSEAAGGGTVTKTIIVKASIKRGVTISILAKSRIQRTVSKTIQAKSRIAVGSITKSAIAKARIQNTYAKSIQAKSNIRVTGGSNVSAKARITVYVSKTISSKARSLKGGVTKIVQAKSNIRKTQTLYIQAKSNVRKTQTLYVQTKCSIRKSVAVQVNGLSNVRRTQQKSATSKANLRSEQQKQISGKCRILVGGIVAVVSVKCNVLAVIGRGTLAKCRVKKTESVGISATARVYTEREYTVAAKAKIVCIGIPVLLYPEKFETLLSPVVLRWEIPVCCKGRNMSCQVQVDNGIGDFTTLERDMYSFRDSGFQYWDGDSWETYPEEGVSSGYYGNEARVQVSLATGETKYWRVRGVVK